MEMVTLGQVKLAPELERKRARGKKIFVTEVFVLDGEPRPESSMHRNSSKTTYVQVMEVIRKNERGENGRGLTHCAVTQHKKIAKKTADLYGLRYPVVEFSVGI